MFAGAGAVVVWWHDRHRAARFTATVWRPEQGDGRLRCVTEPEDQVTHGSSSTALQTQTPPPPSVLGRANVQFWPLEDTTHPTDATLSLSVDQRPTIFLGEQIYTLMKKTKRHLFKRNTRVYYPWVYLTGKKNRETTRRAIFLDRRENTLNFFSVQAMQAVFSVASSVVPATVIYFFSFSCTKQSAFWLLFLCGHKWVFVCCIFTIRNL